MTDLFLLDLEGLKNGRAFDGMAFGKFEDMHGRDISLNVEDAELFVKNTMEAIEATRGESGELAGLPIDSKGHDKGESAGWIKSVAFDGKRLRFVAEWTERGIELIGKKIMRFFSPTVDIVNKVILGGSLTNWPASRDKKGKVMLRPIELSADVFSFEPYVLEAEADKEPDEAINKEGERMTIELTQEQLDELVSGRVKEALAELEAERPEPDNQTVDIGELVSALGLNTAEAEENQIQHLDQLAGLIEKQANLKWQQRLAEMQRKNRYAEMAARVTGGTPDAPRGIPVQSDELLAELMKLSPEQSKFWGRVLEDTVKNGLNDYAELGHSKKMKGTTPLPDDIIANLESGELKLEDLRNPIIAQSLGELSQYDLSKWS